MHSRHRAALLSVIVLALGLMMSSRPASSDMSYVVKVNGQPISSYDVSQRQKFMALTSGALGKRMRALLQAPSTQEKFRQFVQERRPASQAEAEALQKQFVNKLQKDVIANINKKTRDEAIEELIDEHLMLQEAKRQKVNVSEAEVDKRLNAMAKSGNNDRTLNDFLDAFRKQGINPETMKQRIRAQLAWRDVIRKIYGFRIASLVGTSGSDSTSVKARINDATFDVRRLRIPASGGSGQAAIARAYVRGEAIRKQFSSCTGLDALAQQVSGASLERISGKKAAAFPRDARPLLLKASEGQMLPPLMSGRGVDVYAVCAKNVPQATSSEDDGGDTSSDRRQEEFRIYARRHLTDLRQDALIERR